jgi:hypothetical protein
METAEAVVVIVAILAAAAMICVLEWLYRK